MKGKWKVSVLELVFGDLHGHVKAKKGFSARAGLWWFTWTQEEERFPCWVLGDSHGHRKWKGFIAGSLVIYMDTVWRRSYGFISRAGQSLHVIYMDIWRRNYGFISRAGQSLVICMDTDMKAFIARGWSLMTCSFTTKYEWNGFRKVVLT